VIIPVKDGGKTIERALQSVFSQDIKDFNIYVVDDASTDDTPDIVKSFGRQGLTYLRLARTSGTPSVPRNYALRRVSEPYTTFLDADDLWEPDRLSRAASVIMREGVELLFCNGYIKPTAGESAVRTLLSTRRTAPNERLLSKFDLLRTQSFFIQGATVKTSLIRENGIFFNENLRIGEDFDFFYRLIGDKKIYWDDKPCFTYNLRTSGQSHKVVKPWEHGYYQIYRVLQTKIVGRKEREFGKRIERRVLIHTLIYFTSIGQRRAATNFLLALSVKNIMYLALLPLCFTGGLLRRLYITYRSRSVLQR